MTEIDLNISRGSVNTLITKTGALLTDNDELTTDVEILREHHPDLFEELRETACEFEDNNASNWGE